MKRFFAALLRDKTGRLGLAGVLAVLGVANRRRERPHTHTP